MMKTSLLFLLALPGLLLAQPKNLLVNGQLHRDFHREIFTATVEILELDSRGSSFFFTDFDFHSSGQTGAYFEAIRNQKLVELRPFVVNASLQFNDGVMDVDGRFGKQISRTLLGGVWP